MEKKVKSKGHILVVDDEEGIRYLMETKLNKEGYQVTVAANGLHALQKVRSGQKFDLVLSDLKMVGMSGLDFYTELRKVTGNRIPFIIMTGFPEKGKIVQAIKHGVNDVMLKPVKHLDLMQKINELVA